MKDNKLFNNTRNGLAAVGLVTLVLLVFCFVTNLGNLSTIISTITLVKAKSLYSLESSQMLEGASAGIVSSLEDPYSQYLDKQRWEEMKMQLNAEFGGIGVYIVQLSDGRLVVISPIKGTPAEKAGLEHEDIIIKINGETTLNMTRDDAVDRLRGEPGTQVEVTVYREKDKQDHTYTLIREIINVPSVEYKMLDKEQGIGYLKLTQFHAHSTEEMIKGLNGLNDQGAQALILDLRDNGGGDFHVSLAIANMFLDDKDVVSIVDRRGNKQTERSMPGGSSIPVVVLVNGNTASASEILSGALQDNKRAVLVGEKTFGKGLVQTIFPLRNGGALKLTTQKYFTPNGTDINEIGIIPDYTVENPPASDKDLQLEKALSLLKK